MAPIANSKFLFTCFRLATLPRNYFRDFYDCKNNKFTFKQFICGKHSFELSIEEVFLYDPVVSNLMNIN